MNSKQDFQITISAELYQQLTQKLNHQSVNTYVNQLIVSDLSKDENFETKNIIGKIINQANIFQTDHLVLVSGIYYQYVINPLSNQQSFEQCVISGANGNQLEITPIN